ncbi:MAG TPA: HNH endonuclease [Solirubrobacteraceae bacterium]|nr:HNH endonuclease [Solirubrobacteraceae bacterium]
MRLEDLIARDGEACIWCGEARWLSDLTAEHLLPRSRGGRGLPENLAVACRPCNRRRRSRGIAAYARGRLDAGSVAELGRLAEAMDRLAGSESRPHAEYGRRQLNLLRRLTPSPSSAPR